MYRCVRRQALSHVCPHMLLGESDGSGMVKRSMDPNFPIRRVLVVFSIKALKMNRYCLKIGRKLLTE